jgi:AcrR family transcriptional regulator
MAERPFTRSPGRRADDLIRACAAELARAGATGLSVRNVCAVAGVSPGLLRHYFAGIDDLVAATYQAVAAEVTAALDAAVAAAGPDPHARLTAYVMASFRPPIAAPGQLASWAAFWSLVASQPRIAALHGQIYGDYRARLEALLAAQSVPPADTSRAAIAITALVDGLWLELSLGGDVFDAADAEAIAARWLAVWVPAP